MDPKVTIRHETQEDIPAINHLNVQAFGRPGEAAVVDALRVSDKVTLSLVAVDGGQVVGHVLFTPVTIDDGETLVNALGLGPVAVLPERQRQGIGKRLISTGIGMCQEMGHAIMIVLGHPEYYPRFGFVPSSRYGIRWEFDVPEEVFMVMELQEGGLEGVHGEVRYEPEFNEI